MYMKKRKEKRNRPNVRRRRRRVYQYMKQEDTHTSRPSLSNKHITHIKCLATEEKTNSKKTNKRNTPPPPPSYLSSPPLPPSLSGERRNEPRALLGVEPDGVEVRLDGAKLLLDVRERVLDDGARRPQKLLWVEVVL